jgi:flagellar biogenesis protein FliO
MKLRRRVSFFLVLIPTLYIAVELPVISAANSQELQTQESAEQSTPNEQTPPESQGSLFSMFVTMIGLIVVFSFLLYLGLKMYKQTMVDKRFGHLGPEIRVLGTSVLGPKKSLCVVHAFQHVLLLGMTDSQINVLLDIPFENLSEDLRKALLNPDKPEISFKKILDRFSAK